MKLTENIDAVIYKNGIKEEKKEVVVNDQIVEMVINNTITRRFSVIYDSLEEFTVGYLLGESLINNIEDIKSIAISEGVINVQVKKENVAEKETVLCSDASGGQRCKINEVNPLPSTLKVKKKKLIKNMEKLKEKATIWSATGGAHVAALVYEDKFIVKEDVSRHVAVDKAIGAGLLEGVDLTKSYIIYSGRMPADMVIKIDRAQIQMLVSNAAPSLSGCKIAKEGNITLVGFLRGNRFNIYTNPERVIF